MDAGTRKARGRPRDGDIDRKILDAARTLLADGGFRALSFDALSQMTEVPRSMIYRRWPTKVHIANAIAIGGEGRLPDVIDTQGLNGQVLALVHQLLDRYRQPDIGAAAVGVIAATQGDRALQRELQAESETAARGALADIVMRGQATGAISPHASADALFDLVIGSLIYRVLFSVEPLPGDYAERITGLIVDGLTMR